MFRNKYNRNVEKMFAFLLFYVPNLDSMAVQLSGVLLIMISIKHLLLNYNSLKSLENWKISMEIESSWN
jgi:hypothetical protein